MPFCLRKFLKNTNILFKTLLFKPQQIIQQSTRSPQDVLTEEIKDLKAEIHRKDQWIAKMHDVAVSKI